MNSKTWTVLTATAFLAGAFLSSAQTIGDGVDASNLTWTTGGSRGITWSYQPEDFFLGALTFDGVDAAQNGVINDGEQTWIQTTVTGPGSISFWWYAYCEPPTPPYLGDWCIFEVDSVEMDRLTGTRGALSTTPSDWQYRIFQVPGGTHTLRWTYRKDTALTGGSDDVVRLDQVRFVNWQQPTLPEALGTTGVSWTSGGNANPTYWYGQTNVTLDGKAAQSGQIYHNQTNWLQAVAAGVTNLSFQWKVSSEPANDVLELWTNGVLAKTISGEVNWQSNNFKLPANQTNVIRWVYRKDDSLTSGQDCGWLDKVVFSPTPTTADPSIATHPQNTTSYLGQTAVLNVSAQGSGALTYQWRKDGTALANSSRISGAQSSSLSISSLALADDGYYTVLVTSSAGSITSNPAKLNLLQQSQSITFGPLPAHLVTDAPFQLSATASSGLPVSYTSSDTNIATISGSQVTILAGGSVTITASQAGNSTYAAATPVAQALKVNKLTQTIAFAALPSKTTADASFLLNATASSGLPVRYTSYDPGVATVTGNQVTIVGPGTTTITAIQDGNSTYAATSASQDLVITSSTTPFTLAGMMLPNGRFQLTLIGEANRSCQVEVSTNGLPPWDVWTNLTTTGTSTVVIDDTPPKPAKFYRVLSQ